MVIPKGFLGIVSLLTLQQHSQFRNKIFEAMRPLRSISFGKDRFHRRYWVFPNLGGVFVEGSESSVLPDKGKEELEQIHERLVNVKKDSDADKENDAREEEKKVKEEQEEEDKCGEDVKKEGIKDGESSQSSVKEEENGVEVKGEADVKMEELEEDGKDKSVVEDIKVEKQEEKEEEMKKESIKEQIDVKIEERMEECNVKEEDLKMDVKKAVEEVPENSECVREESKKDEIVGEQDDKTCYPEDEKMEKKYEPSIAEEKTAESEMQVDISTNSSTSIIEGNCVSGNATSGELESYRNSGSASEKPDERMNVDQVEDAKLELKEDAEDVEREQLSGGDKTLLQSLPRIETIPEPHSKHSVAEADSQETISFMPKDSETKRLDAISHDIDTNSNTKENILAESLNSQSDNIPVGVALPAPELEKEPSAEPSGTESKEIDLPQEEPQDLSMKSHISKEEMNEETNNENEKSKSLDENGPVDLSTSKVDSTKKFSFGLDDILARPNGQSVIVSPHSQAPVTGDEGRKSEEPKPNGVIPPSNWFSILPRTPCDETSLTQTTNLPPSLKTPPSSFPTIPFSPYMYPMAFPFMPVNQLSPYFGPYPFAGMPTLPMQPMSILNGPIEQPLMPSTPNPSVIQSSQPPMQLVNSVEVKKEPKDEEEEESRRGLAHLKAVLNQIENAKVQPIPPGESLVAFDTTCLL